MRHALSALAAAFALATLALSPAIAQNRPPHMPGMGATGGTPMGGMQQVALTPESVRAFLAAYDKMRVVADKHDTRLDAGDLRDNPGSMFGAMARSRAAMAEFQSVLTAHGFTDFNSWMQVGYSTMLAHGWTDRGGGDPEGQLDQAIAQIRANDRMPAQQREALIAQLEAQRGLMAAYRPLPGNVEIVREMGGDIDAVMNRKQ